jgi:hypothetical protein
MDGEPEKAKARLASHIQSNIGKQLRAMYTDVVAQRIPERLAALVRRLEDKKNDPSRV